MEGKFLKLPNRRSLKLPIKFHLSPLFSPFSSIFSLSPPGRKVVVGIGIIILLLLFRLWLSFLGYLQFTSKSWDSIEGLTTAVYTKSRKNGRKYWVLKLKKGSLTFYTSTYRPFSVNPLNRPVYLEFKPPNVSFPNYLTSFYLPPYHLIVEPFSPPFQWIWNQHPQFKEGGYLFQALFLGGGIPTDLRQKLGRLGVVHLLALSGLHLGLISLLLYLFLSPIYSLLHHRFFPYRNRYFDLGMVILGVEFLYLLFTNFPPSLLRAFGMELTAFLWLYFRLPFKLFPFLLGVVLVAFLISPGLLISLGFFFSLIAVYLIFLYLHHLPPTPFWGIFLPFYLTGAMVPIIHHFFPQLSPYLFLSPIISLLFPLFYGGELIFHLWGVGDVGDSFISLYLQLGENYFTLPISTPLFGLYLGALLLSYFSRPLFLLTPLLPLGIIVNHLFISYFLG
ncbi:MAG: hypothetical protein C6I01_06010 [Epsilonproteobacteria bacterium]|nr:hypothetical protein [Campylobacterota bacterium]